MAVNVRSAFLFTRHALQALIAAKGAVVNVSSIAGKAGEEGLAIYCASKAAMIGLTQAVALEFGEHVRVNAICPGQVDTRMMKSISEDPSRAGGWSCASRRPLRRAGRDRQRRGWLLSSEASYVNGAVITADGGETAGVRLPRACSDVSVRRGA
jgi:NAD(P)-dependent dehydrogenase (short-subunit alcohol dehydrogenase family)